MAVGGGWCRHRHRRYRRDASAVRAVRWLDVAGGGNGISPSVARRGVALAGRSSLDRWSAHWAVARQCGANWPGALSNANRSNGAAERTGAGRS